MKYTYLFLLLCFTLSSCKSYEEPTYVGIEKLTMLDINNDEIVIGAYIKFRNPNNLGGTVKNTNIDVLFEDNVVAKLRATDSYKIPTADTFSVPMEATIPTKALKNNTNSLLGGITGLLINKKIDFHFKGTLAFDLKVMDYEYDIDETQSVALGKQRKQ